MSVLVVDVGTSSVRASVVREDGSVAGVAQRPVAARRPSPGIVEFDPAAVAGASLEVAREALGEHGPVASVGITAQRASSALWDRSTGEFCGPGIGWQDLRTAGQCIALQARGLRLAPNQSATKLAYLLSLNDPTGSRDLCFGTVDTLVAWTLSGGSLHVTDASNAAVTGLVLGDGSDWDDATLEILGLSRRLLPAIVDSTGVIGPAAALPGAPPIAGLVGDQQASLVGQGCLEPGEAKATFGTGAMLDCRSEARPAFAVRGEAGTFPIVAWREHGEIRWGLEAIMLSAGTCVEWLRDGLGLISTVGESAALAASVRSAGGVMFVPAFGGIGTPLWDFGARGALIGLSGATTSAEVVRAVLEGVAQRAVDLLEAVEADSGRAIGALRVDGGMSANETFVQLLADALRRPVEVSPVTEATTIGAAYLAGTAVGTWSSLGEAASTAMRRRVVEPGRPLDRERWLDARDRSLATVPAMSALSF